MVNLYNRHGIYPHLKDIFLSLTFPSLTELGLIGDRETNGTFTGSWPAESFNRFLARPKFHLTTLPLDGIPMSGLEFITTLQLTPSLVHLKIAELLVKEKCLSRRS